MDVPWLMHMAAQYERGMDGYPMDPGSGWHMMSPFGMWTIGLLVLAVAILVGFFSSRGRKDSTESPLETLNRRYASGEIDRDEYLRRKQDILRH